MKIPGVLGDRDKLMCFDPKMYEIVYRTEGVWPYRGAWQTFEYFRRHVRPDVAGGLLFDHGEEWEKMRQVVGPKMLKPDAVKMYVPAIDEVSRDFVSKVHTLLDANFETPGDFAKEIGFWAIESIGVISLDRRLGVFEATRTEHADLLIKVIL